MPVLASWNSETSPGGVVTSEVADNGHAMWLRGRCAGTGELRVKVTGVGFADDRMITCDGRWHATVGFPPMGGQDVGPYPVHIEAPDTLGSWEVVVLQSVALPRSTSR
jgi:hypothetical protein